MKIILYTKNFNKEINEKVDVILSPEFYWIKKINIDIKNIKTAKKVAKNIFDLDEKEYLFDAIKIDKTYFAIAINKDIKFNFDTKLINSIRVAQVEFFKYECLQIDKNRYLKKIDDIIFLLRGENSCENIEKILNNLKLSEYKVNLINYIDIEKHSFILLMLAFLFINIYIISQTISYQSAKKEINKKEENVLKNYPKTTFELKSILSDLEDKYNHQIYIREKLKQIYLLPVNNFKELRFENNTFYIKIISSKNLDNIFKQKFKVLYSKFNKNIYEVRFK